MLYASLRCGHVLVQSKKKKVLGNVVVEKGMPTDIAGLCSSSLLVLPEHVSLSSQVNVYGGVMTKTGQLSHNGSFIKLEDNTEVCCTKNR